MTSPSVQPGIYVKVQIDPHLKLSKLKPGDVIEGTLSRNAYSLDQKFFSAGDRVHLVVDQMLKRPRQRSDHWPWVINAFSPRHEKYPVFKTAKFIRPEGDLSLQVSVLSISRKREVNAHVKKKKGAPANSAMGAVEAAQKRVAGVIEAPVQIMVLEAMVNDQLPPIDPQTLEPTIPASGTLPAGTPCKVLLLGSVSASKSKPGDELKARLLEPVSLGEHVVLPAGTLFEGQVTKRTPPRMLSRAGSLFLSFNALTLPGGNRIPIASSLAGAELDERSHTKIDNEGQLHGEHPGKAWMAINFGVSAGFAKVADDSLQLIIEAIVSTATDVSTAGAGRVASGCASAIFMATRHGRDVVLPRFTELDIALDRPIEITPVSTPPAAGTR